MSTQNRVAIVTGASSGIGKEIAKGLAKQNYSVAMLARRADEMAMLVKTQDKTEATLLPIACDLSKTQEISDAVRQIQQTLGPITVLVNNAGFGGPKTAVVDLAIADWDAIFAVNVRSAFFLTQQVLPDMKMQQFGRIVNISSILGLTGAAGSSAYIASKHALVGLTQAIAVEYGQFGITCNALCPGYIHTSMLKTNECRDDLSHKIPMQRLGTSKEIAKLVTFLVGQESHYLNGSVIRQHGWFTFTCFLAKSFLKFNDCDITYWRCLFKFHIFSMRIHCFFQLFNLFEPMLLLMKI